jgi:serine/threonine-protein kinase
MLYEMVVGETPFEGENLFVVMNARVTGDPVAPRKRNPVVSPQVEEIILHAMERDPSKRYQHAAAMKSELDNPAATVQLTGRCDRLKTPASMTSGGKQTRWIVLAVATALLILGLLIWLIMKRGTAH